MMDFVGELDWGAAAPWILALVLGADKLIAALKRLANAPIDLRDAIEERAEKIHDDAVRDERQSRLAEKADEILGLLRPDHGMSLWDRVDKLDKDFRAYVQDAQRAQRTIIGHLEEAPRDDPA